MPTKQNTKKVSTKSDVVPAGNESPIIADSPPNKASDINSDLFPIVGIGASAGGLAAFEAFFSGIPENVEPNMAFVLVQHLAPDHKSMLSDLIRRCTSMQVFEVEDGMVVRRNCVYIIPPNHDMAYLNGALHLLEPSAPRGQRLPIDYFFRSLARDQCECAIGIVLSGTGSDGTLGLRAIKGEGGMVMAQTAESCDFDGMPRSAITTGLTDYVLPPEEMAVQLIAYATHAFGKLPRPVAVDTPKVESALKKIFIMLRAQTGHDFSQYKPSTINRRIERRMAVHQIGDLSSYVAYLQQTPAEAQALFRDLLIGVTNFFRDPDVFEVMEKQIIPKLFEHKNAGAVIRIWSAGCSTGEEAYSIAILLQEHMEALKQNFTVQVFATDIDSRAIAFARAGLYPASISADITPERLARYFSVESDGSAFRIHKSIRDMLVFSEQDLIKDPPFSKLDLISCRNLMIYLGAQLQKKLIPLFHYALKPGGVLFLGTSEGVGDFVELFAALDRKAKVYERSDDYPGRHNLPGHLLPHPSALDLTSLVGAKKMTFPVKLPLRELTEQALLHQLVPSAVLVNWQGDILYLHGRTGSYLEPAQGEVGVLNIVKMAREGLRRELSLALQKAISGKEVVYCYGLRVKTNGHFTTVDLTVCPVTTGRKPIATANSEPHLYLVILEDKSSAVPELLRVTASSAGDLDNDSNLEIDSRIALLKQELRTKDEYLRSTHEELESSNEELKSSNEEMQSVNEELQSTNEELETSKEELQSVNEELATVNNELQTKVADLSRANNDMNNLLAGNGIGTVFVDFQLRILRFTPAASSIINLILSDVGRPVGHIVSNLVGYDTLLADTQAVLDTLKVKEINVQTTDGNWYTMRIQPYRTLDNVIEGAVISFIDITETVRTRDALHKANELLRLAVVVRDAQDAITMQDLEGRTLAWNPAAIRLYGWTEAEALAMNVKERIPPEAQTEALKMVQHLDRAEILKPYRSQRLTKNGNALTVQITSSALLNEAGEMYAIATTERAVSADNE
jgi:two-component system CheB/CheR fusion protein